MASPSESAAVAARFVVDLATGLPPRLGAGRLLCLDGPAGSGKTTLAAAVAELTDATVVHMDDLMAGWDHATETTSALRGLLEPLADGTAGHYQRYDWWRDRPGRRLEVTPTPWLVVEGVGAGNPAVAHLATVLVWVEADDAELRLARGMARDGERMRDRWLTFMRDEAAMFEAHRTRERAHVLVDGTGVRPPVVQPIPS